MSDGNTEWGREMREREGRFYDVNWLGKPFHLFSFFVSILLWIQYLFFPSPLFLFPLLVLILYQSFKFSVNAFLNLGYSFWCYLKELFVLFKRYSLLPIANTLEGKGTWSKSWEGTCSVILLNKVLALSILGLHTFSAVFQASFFTPISLPPRPCFLLPNCMTTHWSSPSVSCPRHFLFWIIWYLEHLGLKLLQIGEIHMNVLLRNSLERTGH